MYTAAAVAAVVVGGANTQIKKTKAPFETDKSDAAQLVAAERVSAQQSAPPPRATFLERDGGWTSWTAAVLSSECTMKKRAETPAAAPSNPLQIHFTWLSDSKCCCRRPASLSTALKPKISSTFNSIFLKAAHFYVFCSGCYGRQEKSLPKRSFGILPSSRSYPDRPRVPLLT